MYVSSEVALSIVMYGMLIFILILGGFVLISERLGKTRKIRHKRA